MSCNKAVFFDNPLFQKGQKLVFFVFPYFAFCQVYLSEDSIL